MRLFMLELQLHSIKEAEEEEVEEEEEKEEEDDARQVHRGWEALEILSKCVICCMPGQRLVVPQQL